MVYVTSDLHGIHPRDFQGLLARAGFSDSDYLFVLGDVIDRGEYGAELLLWLTEQPNISLILGNHEALMLACGFLFQEVTEESLEALDLKAMALVENWMENGGRPTLEGFRRLMKRDPELMEGILDYLREAPLYEQLRVNGKQFVLVHAGLGNFRPDKPLEEYAPEELLMGRPALGEDYSPDITVIFGHTPTMLYGEAFAGRMLKTRTWRCIDTGAACGFGPMLLRLEDEAVWYWNGE